MIKALFISVDLFYTQKNIFNEVLFRCNYFFLLTRKVLNEIKYVFYPIK